jgi:hypothetical protein
MRLAYVEGPFVHKHAPPLAILREGCPFGESWRGAVPARLADVLEVAPE